MTAWLAANWWWLALAGAVLLILGSSPRTWSCLHGGKRHEPQRDEHEDNSI